MTFTTVHLRGIRCHSEAGSSPVSSALTAPVAGTVADSVESADTVAVDSVAAHTAED